MLDALGDASDTMMAHPLAQFPAPLVSTIEELGAFLAREKVAAIGVPAPVTASAGNTQAA